MYGGALENFGTLARISSTLSGDSASQVDGQQDFLHGQIGCDWFFAHANDRTDNRRDEIVTPI